MVRAAADQTLHTQPTYSASSVKPNANTQHGGIHEEAKGPRRAVAEVAGAHKGAVVQRRIQLAILGDGGAHGPQAAPWWQELHVEDAVIPV